jgi:hypothetical protein
MPPITSVNSTITPQIPRSARHRSGHEVRSPGGPDAGLRQVCQATASISRMVAMMPGMTPAANISPMLVSVMRL